MADPAADLRSWASRPGLLAIPLGVAMGDLLIQVINLRSFGWTMPMQVTPNTLASGVLLAWIAAVIAGLYPACARWHRTKRW
jgi:ABC-type antimicrobial peptide transport system permease subunit